MKRYQQIIPAFLFALLSACPTEAGSLDELYRDIVRSENQGYLPMFVKNRSIPDILPDESTLGQIKGKAVAPLKEPVPAPVNLTNDRLAREAARKAAVLQWENTLKAVAENRVTPVELEEINYRALQNDPRAVEVLAWMNARGVGVKTDLIQAFHLYQKAAALNVPNAAENAAQVYKVMKPEQRRFLTRDKNNS